MFKLKQLPMTPKELERESPIKNEKKSIKNIEYFKNGNAFADAKAEEAALDFLSSEDGYICVSTENFIYAIRCLIAEGKFPHDQVVILFEGQTLHIDKYGVLKDNYPVGFCDNTMDWLRRLMKCKKVKNNE